MEAFPSQGVKYHVGAVHRTPMLCRELILRGRPAARRIVSVFHCVLIQIIKNSPSVNTLDITGGAPELNSHFRYMVEEGRALGLDVIDR